MYNIILLVINEIIIFAIHRNIFINAMNNFSNWYVMTDSAIIKEIGKGIRQVRLNKNISQEKLSNMSGVDRVTISRMESGRVTTLITFVQILRSLDMLDRLNIFKQELEISPIKLLEMQEKKRKKASSARPKNNFIL
jgi:predicted transcriptional regulator